MTLAASSDRGAGGHGVEDVGACVREVERDGRRMQVREPAESWQPAQLRMELDGTRIDMHSNDVGAAALADLAAGLVRAPTEPPDLGG
jgi:hypothetical protein